MPRPTYRPGVDDPLDDDLAADGRLGLVALAVMGAGLAAAGVALLLVLALRPEEVLVVGLPDDAVTDASWGRRPAGEPLPREGVTASDGGRTWSVAYGGGECDEGVRVTFLAGDDVVVTPRTGAPTSCSSILAPYVVTLEWAEVPEVDPAEVRVRRLP